MKIFIPFLFLAISVCSCNSLSVSENQKLGPDTEGLNNQNTGSNKSQIPKTNNEPYDSERLKQEFPDVKNYEEKSGVPLVTVYDASGSVHCYLYLTTHRIHKNLFSGISPVAENIISKVDSIYFERQDGDVAFKFMNQLFTTKWSKIPLVSPLINNLQSDDKTKFEQLCQAIDLEIEDREKFLEWFLGSESRFHKLYDQYQSATGVNNVFIPIAPNFYVDHLKYFTGEDDYISVEAELQKISLKYNKTIGGLENNLGVTTQEEAINETQNDIQSFFITSVETWKLLNDETCDYKSKVKKEYEMDMYYQTHASLRQASAQEPKFTSRHDEWMKTIPLKKNVMYCFGASHLFGYGDSVTKDSIYNRLHNLGYRMEWTYAEQVYKDFSNNPNATPADFDQATDKLSFYPYQKAKLLLQIHDILKSNGNIDAAKTWAGVIRGIVATLKQNENKVGYTDSDLNALLSVLVK